MNLTLQSFLHRHFPRLSKPPSKDMVYRPIVLQCGAKGKTARCTTLKTWLVCWPDHCDPSYMVIFWTVFSFGFFLADMASDISVAFEYLESKDYIWSGLLFGFTILPCIIAQGYFVAVKKAPWYEAYPFGVIFWSWRTVQTFLALPPNEAIKSAPDAANFLHKLREFQACNRQRTNVSDLDVYFGSMPQLILQSYIAADVAVTTGAYKITWNSWLSLALSSLNMLRYEPSARESEKGIIVDVETVLEPAMYDYIAENLFDLMSVVPRAVTIGCFLSIQPSYVALLSFFPPHILVGFLWFWLSSPKKIPGYRSHDRDFRGQRRDRHDYLAHFQAALATLLFPPTNKAWPENFLLWRDRFRAVATKQFVVVTVFQFLETEALLWIWVFLADANVPVLPTLLAVTGWTVLRILCHVGYYVFLLFPLYTCEWEQCTRRRGLIAKMEITRMAEELGGYFCPKLKPRLVKTRDLCSSKSDISSLRQECQWLVDHLLSESVGHTKRSRTQKHRLKAMSASEKDLLRSVRREAANCLRSLDNRRPLSTSDMHAWQRLIDDCQGEPCAQFSINGQPIFHASQECRQAKRKRSSSQVAHFSLLLAGKLRP
ncbi:hypothetical protein RvY_13420 [Ramazzottius varieornatus]|uniref:XK-related protein n=1 Tax=Ramazzottius varieornatus TaxID=947166 RepID=A0A1D1VT46_RAMVA|nr:hypothetical protein RvY_13420 [Ramazzottius varieornatus]